MVESSPRSLSLNRNGDGDKKCVTVQVCTKAAPNVSCGCLSSLYLALESLRHLPFDVSSAMRVLSNACRVAQDVAEYCLCSFSAFIDDPLRPPPIQGFQSLMLLGALVPSICNACAFILESVDVEAADASTECRSLFSLKDVGGFAAASASILDPDDTRSAALRAVDDTFLEPGIWRTTVRAILKFNIHGLGYDGTTASASKNGQQGLKDVLVQLDTASRQRHQLLDELLVSGRIPKDARHLYFSASHAPCPPEQRNCVKIIETVRMALEKLVIN